MGERKVLNRYFPPDFDPLLVPKRKYDPYKQVEVRMMIPFSLQCIKCGEYMYRGKKFNSRKEDVIGDDYLGIKKYRFYIKCCVCNNEIAFKTDPKNQDYVCESGSFGGVPFLLPLPWWLHPQRRAVDASPACRATAGSSSATPRRAAAPRRGVPAMRACLRRARVEGVALAASATRARRPSRGARRPGYALTPRHAIDAIRERRLPLVARRALAPTSTPSTRPATQAPRATSSPGASRTRPRRSSRASARRPPRRTR